MNLNIEQKDFLVVLTLATVGVVISAGMIATGMHIPHHTEIITVTFGIVAFLVFVQGLTMQPMLKAMGEIPTKI